MLHSSREHLGEPIKVQRVHRDVGEEAKSEGESRDVFPFLAERRNRNRTQARARKQRQRRPHLRQARAPELDGEFHPEDDPGHEEARHHREAAKGVRSALLALLSRGRKSPAEVDKGRGRLEEQEGGRKVGEPAREGAQAEEAAADGAWCAARR